jgi:hypothetical protein
MAKVVYVVMKQEIDWRWSSGPRSAHGVFTDRDEAEAYCRLANITHQESLGAGPPNYYFWVDYQDFEMDPQPYEGETSWVRAAENQSKA